MVYIPKQLNTPPMPKPQEIIDFENEWKCREIAPTEVQFRWLKLNPEDTFSVYDMGCTCLNYFNYRIENKRLVGDQIVVDFVFEDAVIEDEKLEDYVNISLDEMVDNMNTMREEIEDLHEKLKKARKKAKRWKRKYLELTQDMPNVIRANMEEPDD